MVTTLASGAAVGVAVMMEQHFCGGGRRFSGGGRRQSDKARVAISIDSSEVLTSEDGRGAQMVHALLVNNGPAAIALAMELIALRLYLL
tara:strand:- start:580 stop:846 length:267 start_codon:yes stop_codon:yes gene_type:complete